MQVLTLPQNTRLHKRSQLLKMILGNEHMNDSQIVSRLKNYGIKCTDNIDVSELFEAMKKHEKDPEQLGNYKAKSKAL